MFGTQVQSTGNDRKQQYKELSKGCSMYEPCPLCYKCMNKATHLYIRCETCPLEFCGHSHKHRSFMIRRENFGINVTDETGEEFKKLSEQADGICTCGQEGKEEDGEA
jgi:hypothetical protein